MKQKFPKSDFTKNMLPQSRKAIFRDVMQLHWQKLLLLGVILLVFYIPILLSDMRYDSQVSAIYQAVLESSQAEAAGMAVIQLDLIRSTVRIFWLMLLAVGAAGIIRVIRQYAWEENVHIPTDFAKGIRDNAKQTISIAALSGILSVLCLTVFYTADSYRSTLVSVISLLPIAISLLLVLPMVAISLVMVPIYTTRLGTTLKNAFFVYTRNPLKHLGFLLLCLAIWVPSLLPNAYCHLFGSIAAVLLTPMAFLAWTLFCYERLDQHFNPLVAPELIGKGIFQDKQI